MTKETCCTSMPLACVGEKAASVGDSREREESVQERRVCGQPKAGRGCLQPLAARASGLPDVIPSCYFPEEGHKQAHWRGNHLGSALRPQSVPSLLTLASTQLLLTSRSVVINTLLEPERNSLMMTSRSFWSMSPCYNRKQKAAVSR